MEEVGPEFFVEIQDIDDNEFERGVEPPLPPEVPLPPLPPEPPQAPEPPRALEPQGALIEEGPRAAVAEEQLPRAPDEEIIENGERRRHHRGSRAGRNLRKNRKFYETVRDVAYLEAEKLIATVDLMNRRYATRGRYQRGGRGYRGGRGDRGRGGRGRGGRERPE